MDGQFTHTLGPEPFVLYALRYGQCVAAHLWVHVRRTAAPPSSFAPTEGFDRLLSRAAHHVVWPLQIVTAKWTYSIWFNILNNINKPFFHGFFRSKLANLNLNHPGSMQLKGLHGRCTGVIVAAQSIKSIAPKQKLHSYGDLSSPYPF